MVGVLMTQNKLHAYMHTCTECLPSHSRDRQGAQCQAWPCEGLCRYQGTKATVWWPPAANDWNLSPQPVPVPSFV